jgi:hypothetical protein
LVTHTCIQQSDRIFRFHCIEGDSKLKFAQNVQDVIVPSSLTRVYLLYQRR